MHSAMEQTRLWMWSRRKFDGGPLLDSLTPSVAAPRSDHDSWEEQAFAEDSAGHLGGSVWPPRSYSCSFCGREFRSAQALGGHMNVHRRDRARLRQSSSSSSIDNQEVDRHHHDHLNPCTLIGTNCTPKALAPPYHPASIIQECRKEYLLSTPRLTIMELKLGRENWELKQVGCRRPRDPSEDDEETISRKRGRADPEFCLFLKPSNGDKQPLPSDILKPNPSLDGELDLELRLGDPPKVK